MHLGVAAFAYYTLAVTSYAFLLNWAFGAPEIWTTANDGANTQKIGLAGIVDAIDTREEYVLVFAIFGLSLTMVDTIFSLAQLVFGGEGRFEIEPQQIFGNDSLVTAAKIARQAGSAGVYLATLMFATQSHYHDRIKNEYIMRYNDGQNANEEIYDYLQQSRAIPYLLAATASVLGAVLCQPVEKNGKKLDTGFLSLTPLKGGNGRTGSQGYYA